MSSRTPSATTPLAAAAATQDGGDAHTINRQQQPDDDDQADNTFAVGRLGNVSANVEKQSVGPVLTSELQQLWRGVTVDLRLGRDRLRDVRASRTWLDRVSRRNLGGSNQNT